MTKLSYKAFSIDTEAVAPAGIEYLLQYGFAQSMQDCIAGRAKAVREELAEKMKQPDAIQLTDAEIETAVEADLNGALGKRMDAILAGTVAVRQAAEAKDPASGIVRELLVAWAKSKGGKLPKADSDEYKALAAKMRAAKADHIAAELARRAEAVADIDIDL
jgi:hypothetical protein